MEVRVLVGERRRRVDDVRQVSDAAEIEQLVRAARGIHVPPAVFDYMRRARHRHAADAATAARGKPAGALGLLRTSRVYAALRGRPYVVPGDVQQLAEPVLAHRLLPTAEAQIGRRDTDAGRRRPVETRSPARRHLAAARNGGTVSCA